ncbi:UbiA family prenyltransferase [Rhodococcoides corynebacterioides]|uniref:UbiA family prenyltransferase n=1 Tax=Rhodococcoides corynebacterioides TaxID=53972 RepID=A0ABS7P5N9_9NOCA|nr:UbiA family prenyltransferase [Rhodococcus corynebacterioides]MBY6367727.1 UbiA family prenyltransferase [Rhodococcus corynebacterioides]MBY6408514.1 UbiA family prenyltransferase [Rhodococcus corynebacterioides]
MSEPSRAQSLLISSHPGPAVAVTAIAAVLTARLSPSPAQVIVVVVAVASGQLLTGWTNDLVDADRDRAVGRTDKPLARGVLSRRAVRTAIAVSAVVCVVASLLLGVVPGLLHLVLGVGAALAYNVGLKSTVVSWLPYTIAFGALPAVVSLAIDDALPPLWTVAVGSLLGFGAHLVNVLPDLADDRATGISGFPHRLPPAAVAPTAVGALSLASIVGVGGARGFDAVGVLALVAVGVCALVALTGSGRRPFQAAIAIAAVDVAVLVTA